MKFSFKNLFLVPVMALLLLGATSCSESSSSVDSIPEVAATEEDIEALSNISGEKLSVDSKSENLSGELASAGASSLSARIQSLANGTTFAFFDSVLTVEDNSVSYNDLSYDFVDSFEEDGSNYHLFSNVVSETQYKELQIATSNTMNSYLSSEFQVSEESNIITVVLSGNSRVEYFNDLEERIARFEITNLLATIVGTRTGDASVATADHDHEEVSEIDEEPTSEESETSYVLSIFVPFTLSINDLTYTGEFSGVSSLGEEEQPEMTSALIRNGQNIGEVRINGNDELEIFLRNEEGELVEVE